MLRVAEGRAIGLSGSPGRGCGILAEKGEHRTNQPFEQVALGARPGQDADAQQDTDEQACNIRRRLGRGNGSITLPRLRTASEELLHLHQNAGNDALELGIVGCHLES